MLFNFILPILRIKFIGVAPGLASQPGAVHAARRPRLDYFESHTQLRHTGNIKSLLGNDLIKMDFIFILLLNRLFGHAVSNCIEATK